MRTTAGPVARRLRDGLVLRTAGPADLDQIGALLTARGTAADAIDHALVMADPEAGWSSCAVVVDGDRVVSTVTLLDETLVLSGLPIPAGQVELVATDRGYEGRGLVRGLMTWAHDRSATLGHLAQVMLGIPYFYRQFGYSYAIPIRRARPVAGRPPAGTGPHEIRTAQAADIPAMAALNDREQAGAMLHMPHSAACWRWLVARGGTTQWLVERAGVPVATGRTTPPAEGVVLGEIAATDPPAAYALLHHATDLAGERGALVVDRPGTVAGRALDPYLGPPPARAEQYYIRVPDPVALLDHLRPVLSARLRASDLAGASGEVIISFFRSHVRFRYAEGDAGPMTAGGVLQAPGAAGGAGVAPDLIGALLFGPHGIAGLTLVHPDAYPGPNHELMETLFPPVDADLLTFYLP